MESMAGERRCRTNQIIINVDERVSIHVCYSLQWRLSADKAILSANIEVYRNRYEALVAFVHRNVLGRSAFDKYRNIEEERNRGTYER